MKKRLLAILLSALLVANISACSYVPENGVGSKTEAELTGSDTSNASLSEAAEISGISKDLSESTRIVSQCVATNEKLTVDFRSYDSIVSTFRKIVALCPQYETVKDDEHFVFADATAYELHQELFFSTLALYPNTWKGLDVNCYNRFGYTVKDLNSDGVDELILRLDDHQVIAIFTTVNDTPVMLGNFWNRKTCWIDPDGYLHIGGSSGADRSVMQIFRISNETGELILLEEGGTNGHDELGNALYYKLVNSEKSYITQEEYNVWKSSLPYANFKATESISTYLPFVQLFDAEHHAPAPYVSQAKG